MPPRKSLKPKLATGKGRLAPDSPAKNTRSNSNDFQAGEKNYISPAKSPRKRPSVDDDEDTRTPRAAQKIRSKSASPLKRTHTSTAGLNPVPVQYSTTTKEIRTLQLPDIAGVSGLWPPASLGTSRFSSPGRRLGSIDSNDGSTPPESPPLQILRKRSRSPKKFAPVQPDIIDPFRPGSLSKEHQKLLVHLSGRGSHQKCPRMMSLGEISESYHAIQEATHIYANQYFAFDLTTEERTKWPLHKLRTHYPALFLNAQYLSDGGQAGWHDLFTRPQHRKYLVTAILSEWMMQRIFKHTAFGMDEKAIEELEDIDREYIHYDAVVRSKKKSKLLTEMLYKSDSSRRTHIESVRRDVDALASELVTVLDPLLPPVRRLSIGNDGKPDEQINERDWIRQSHKAHIRDTILMQAANLALSIRISCQDGTVIRTVPPIPKGSKYTGSASMICVNAEDCVNVPLEHRKDKQLCVRMNCWPRIEAIRPHGPDINELEILEAEGRAELLRNNKGSAEKQQSFSWNEYESYWPELPEDLHHMVKDDHVSDDDISDDNPNGSKSGSRPKRKATHDPERASPSKRVKRAAYMTIYPRVCCATVYCEWTPLQQICKHQSLTEAVAEARSQWSPLLKVEDQYINLRNHFATFSGGYQWLLLAAFIYGVTQHGPISLTRQLLNSATRALLNPVSLITRWTCIDRVPVREAILTHILGAGAVSNQEYSPEHDSEGTESIHPSILLRALQPYIASRSQLRSMSGQELTAHLYQALNQYLKETFRPFGQVSFSIPAALKEAFNRNGGVTASGARGSSSNSALTATQIMRSAGDSQTLMEGGLTNLYSESVHAVSSERVVRTAKRTKSVKGS